MVSYAKNVKQYEKNENKLYSSVVLVIRCADFQKNKILLVCYCFSVLRQFSSLIFSLDFQRFSLCSVSFQLHKLKICLSVASNGLTQFSVVLTTNGHNGGDSASTGYPHTNNRLKYFHPSLNMWQKERKKNAVKCGFYSKTNMVLPVNVNHRMRAIPQNK